MCCHFHSIVGPVQLTSRSANGDTPRALFSDDRLHQAFPPRLVGSQMEGTRGSRTTLQSSKADFPGTGVNHLEPCQLPEVFREASRRGRQKASCATYKDEIANPFDGSGSKVDAHTRTKVGMRRRVVVVEELDRWYLLVRI